MSRYRVTGDWMPDTRDREPFRFVGDDDNEHVLAVEMADITDTKNGSTYLAGANRVTLDGKPFKRGKGGTVPHFGEMAWMNACRDFDDEVTRIRFAR